MNNLQLLYCHYPNPLPSSNKIPPKQIPIYGACHHWN